MAVPKGYSKSNIAKELLQSDIGGLVGLSPMESPRLLLMRGSYEGGSER